jgi:murein DD-endopeptidase MepM/ murein hydrolase activator NlpD
MKKAAPAKAASAKAAPTKATATKAASAKAASVATDAPVATEATSAPAAEATSAAEAAPAPARRPTPYKRTPAATTAADAPKQSLVAVEETPAPAPAAPAFVEAPVPDAAVEAPVSDAAVETEAADVIAAVAEGRRPGFLRRRPPSIGRRPALYLAAALVGGMSTSVIATEGPAAHAETMSSSVSVAQELGLTSHRSDALTEPGATERLVEVTASRNERDAEQAAAAQAQADADAAAAQAAAEAARPKVVLPVAGARLTSTFGQRWGTLHAGIDLAAPIGTPEYAAMDGVVLEAGPASGFGLAVYIQHENGDVTVYGHMEEILVSAGQVVKAGDTIALLGNRGQSTGPHLHFEVHVGGLNGTKIDPLPWLRERGISI